MAHMDDFDTAEIPLDDNSDETAQLYRVAKFSSGGALQNIYIPEWIDNIRRWFMLCAKGDLAAVTLLYTDIKFFYYLHRHLLSTNKVTVKTKAVNKAATPDPEEPKSDLPEGVIPAIEALEPSEKKSEADTFEEDIGAIEALHAEWVTMFPSKIPLELIESLESFWKKLVFNITLRGSLLEYERHTPKEQRTKKAMGRI